MPFSSRIYLSPNTIHIKNPSNYFCPFKITPTKYGLLGSIPGGRRLALAGVRLFFVGAGEAEGEDGEEDEDGYEAHDEAADCADGEGEPEGFFAAADHEGDEAEDGGDDGEEDGEDFGVPGGDVEAYF